MTHKSKIEQITSLRRQFITKRCPSPYHWCNGEVIPPEGRLEMEGHERDLRNRSPCEYYSIDRGCTYIKHPKFSAEWKHLRRDKW